MTNHVAFGAPGSRELGVFLAPQDGEMRGEERSDECGDQEDVDDEEPGEDVVGGELSAEDEKRGPLPHDWDREHD